jgi:glutathione S-transferase
MTAEYELYGAEASYFTGKVRAYLRYKCIPFRETLASRSVYAEVILPRVGWPVIPVVVTPEGETLQDSSEIIDALEMRFIEAPVYPAMACQRFAALLLEVYADEWLKIPAMHYRWTKNRDFAIAEFGKITAPELTGEAQHNAGEAAAKRFAGALPFLGATAETAAAIETSYEALLAELDTHFAAHEFLLGSRPSIGDFGLIGPLYAHQYRDPASGQLMKSAAPRVAAWVERMMTPPRARGGEFLADDEVPATLLPVLARMMREMLPVLVSTAHSLTAWVKDNAEHSNAVGTALPRTLGKHAFTLEGVTGTRAIYPFDLWMLQRPLDCLRSLPEADRRRCTSLLSQVGGEVLFDFPEFPRLTRRNFKLVLA